MVGTILFLFIGRIYGKTHKSQVNSSMNFYISHTPVTTTRIKIQNEPGRPGGSLLHLARPHPHPKDNLYPGGSVSD